MNESQATYCVGLYEPNAYYEWNGSLDAMDWYGSLPKPTQTDLDALWVDNEAAFYAASNETVKALRAAAYREQADPLFFKWQRGEDGVTETDWLAAVEAVRIAYPYAEPATEE